MDEKAWSRGLPAGHKSVLAAGRRITATGEAKQAVWSALSVKLPAAAATAGATAHALTLASLVKPLAVGLVLGAATASGIAGVRSLTAEPPRAPSALAPSRAAGALAPAPERPAPGRVESPAAESLPERALSGARGVTPAAPSPALPAPPDSTASVASFPEESAPSTPESATLRESRLLAEARTAWRRGDARAALTALDALEREFPLGVLVQEREALRIQALAALGERTRAQALAQRFLEQHPNSPHAEAIRLLVR
jgi:hypothetical protein